MFFKLAFLASLVIFAVATPTPNGVSSGPANLCCDQTQTADSTTGLAALGSIGVVVQGLTAILGTDCSPVSLKSLSRPWWMSLIFFDCCRELVSVEPRALPTQSIVSNSSVSALVYSSQDKASTLSRPRSSITHWRQLLSH